MRTSSHESFHEKDLRKKIVQALQRGATKTEAARTFGVSLSSIKRYADRARRGEPLAPEKSPGSAPKLDEKARRLLADDLQERPFVSLQDRCDYMEVVPGIRMSRSTMSRAIARIGSTRKEGDDPLRSATSL